jgi:predicted Zn finger-like uncharacterized protein
MDVYPSGQVATWRGTLLKELLQATFALSKHTSCLYFSMWGFVINLPIDKYEEWKVRFYCPGCQSSFTVPDEKIPKGRTPKVPCPKCRVLMEPREDLPGAPGHREQQTPNLHRQTDPIEDFAMEEEDVPLDLVDEGVQTALICVSDESLSERLRNVFVQLDFYVVQASRAPFAVAKLRHNRYDLVLVEDSFGRIGGGENPILQHMQFLPMHSRRTFFLCLLTSALSSMDRMTAYRMGVDMILNMRDLENVKILLPRGMKEHRNFYAVFTDELYRRAPL